MQLSIIIVNYNVKYFLEQCLCSVIAASHNIETEIFVVDNNSGDGSKNFLANRFTKVKFIWLKDNMGFSKANNIALNLATGKHILFLNPDTIIPEDCLEQCIHFFETQHNIGATGVHMIDGSGIFLRESKRAFPSPLTSLFKLCGLASLFPRSAVFARYYLGDLDEKKTHEADVIAGAFMMIHKSVLDEVGGFDEAFFMYGEDIDLSYRIKKAGYKNFYFAEITIIHFKGESTKKNTDQYVKLFYGAMIIFVKKHYGHVVARIYSIIIQFAIIIKSAMLIFHKKKLSSAKKQDNLKMKQALIVCNKQELESAKALIKKMGLDDLNIERISTNLFQEETLANLAQLDKLVATHNAKEIIFFTKDLSVKEFIYIIQQLPSGFNYWFHLAGSIGIAGSGK